MNPAPGEGALGDLTDDELHVAVYGPGFGETVLVRVPPGIWIVVDGCYVGGRPPAVEVLTQRGERWGAVILTHPHEDHARGIAEVLDLQEDGLVGCTDLNVDDPAAWSRSGDPARQATAGAVEDALAAISDRWERFPERKWLLRAGSNPVRVGDATLTVLHPDAATVERFASRRDHANRLSAPILLEWADIRVLLGADALEPDWGVILAGRTDLGDHTLLKVPHHGSSGAISAAYAREADPESTWIVTPYARGRRLPRFEDGEGCSILLRHVRRLCLTGLPLRFEDQGRTPYATTRGSLRDGSGPVPDAMQLYPGLVAVASPEADRTNACWVMASFARGAAGLPTIQYGPGALEVTEDAQPTHDPATASVGRARR